MISLIYCPLEAYAGTEIKKRDWKKYRATYYYAQLDDNEKKIYDEMDKVCTEFISSKDDAERMTSGSGEDMVESFNLPVVQATGLDKSQTCDIIRQFYFDNPQYYFLATNEIDISVSVSGVVKIKLSVLKEFAYGESRAEITERFFNKVEKWEEEIKAVGTSRYAREKAAIEIICSNVSYNYNDYDKTAYGAVMNGKAVCNGYAMLTGMLLNAVGVPTLCVHGIDHAWNKVCLDDGEWYATDTTWIDGDTPNKEKEKKDYKYFNISDEKMNELDDSGAHKITGPEIQPVCDKIFDSDSVEDDNSDSEGNSGKSNSQNNSSDSNKSKERISYSNEWVNGKWYNADGKQTYKGTMSWKNNATGWWIEDSEGWYPTAQWQKIDGVWYYFKPDGYMAMGEYYNGYWFNKDGSWDDKYLLSWKSNATGWWVEDKSGWWPSNAWLKIDNYWYYFNSSGYMVTNQYVDGYWIGADGVCY